MTALRPLLLVRGQPFQRLLMRIGADEPVHPLIPMERDERIDVLSPQTPQQEPFSLNHLTEPIRPTTGAL
ncbi:hypothetical protein GCM10010359_50460 [Streptomyces morookaense]|nr:hypothetical protein GCM10010359_50460 [Streptomyces morookaense]